MVAVSTAPQSSCCPPERPGVPLFPPCALAQLLGFPIQVLGLLVLPWLGVRYLVDKKDFGSEVSSTAVSRHVTKGFRVQR